MPDLRPAPDVGPAAWLLRDQVDWWTLVRYGPPDFEVYLRVDFGGGDEETDEPLHIRTVLATLAAYTSTPEHGYAAIWEGWCGQPCPVDAPVVPVPHRTMLLFTGPVHLLTDAAALAWGHADGEGAQEPHLVWPADQSWCLACEVDEEVEFSVGCSHEAAAALERAQPGGVRRVEYGENAPVYRDEA